MLIILKCLILSWFINNFEPLREVCNTLLSYKLRPIFKIITKSMLRLLSCYKCCAFWTTLLLTGNIFTASLCAYLAVLYTNRLKPYEEYIKIM